MIPARASILRSVPAPSFSRDFAGTKALNNGIGPAISFSRGSNATYFDSTGTLQTASNNIPRFDHDPVTLQSRGLLIEESRINLNLNSATGSLQTITLVSGSSYTLSFYGTGSMVMAGAYTGTVTGTGAFPTRRTLTFTAATTSLVISSVTGTVQYVQLELGTFPTSYIPTGASQATRGADVAQIVNSTSLGISNSQGTYLVKYLICSPSALSDTRRWSLYISESGTSRLAIRTCDPTGFLYPNTTLNDGQTGNVIRFPSATGVGPHAISFSWNNSISQAACDFVFSGNGAAQTAVPTTNLVLGGQGGGVGMLSGWISFVSYYPTPLNSQQLVALTR